MCVLTSLTESVRFGSVFDLIGAHPCGVEREWAADGDFCRFNRGHIFEKRT